MVFGDNSISNYPVSKGPSSSNINWVTPSTGESRPSFNDVNLQELEHGETSNVTGRNNLPGSTPETPTAEGDTPRFDLSQEKLEQQKQDFEFQLDVLKEILRIYQDTHIAMRQQLLQMSA